MIAIIAILLVVLVPAISSLSKSGGRKAAIGSLLGAIEQARVQAIKDGQATYVVFPTFSNATPATLDRYHYKSFAIFEDDSANSVLKQLTAWKTLPTGVALRAAGAGSLTSLPDLATLTPPSVPTFTPDTGATPVFHCIKFNSSGEVEAPPSQVTVSVFEGHVDGAAEVITSSKDANGNPAAMDSLRIARLTGRAEAVP